jgi:hypothetical protein
VKALLVSHKQLAKEGRWDFDYHSPPELVYRFPSSILKKVEQVAEVVKPKKDPTKEPDATFFYVDIASVDVEIGEIARSQEMTGSEAPSRARKLISGYDIIVSTCRPTRKAIAVVPEDLHGQICSTGFCVVRARSGANPYYLHFVLRLDSTMEQFRKFSTGSSYPAILDTDVEKTLVPVPSLEVQDKIVKRIRHSLNKRNKIVIGANREWKSITEKAISAIVDADSPFPSDDDEDEAVLWRCEDILARIHNLRPLNNSSDGVGAGLFSLDEQ